MTQSAHLWAIGYDDMGRAEQVREVITRLGWEAGQGGPYLNLLDVAVAVRRPDGTCTMDREPFPAAANIGISTTMGLLVGLALGAPLTCAGVGALLGGGVSALTTTVGFGEGFVREVEGLMKPGTSALFVLDTEGEMEVILHTIRGMGGTVLKTNVDLERARLIQSTLGAAPADPAGPEGRPA
jgi:uncharacterized membrane protein